MNFNIDAIIFVCFLVINLGIGLFASKGTKNLREYAIGTKDFSTPALTATIIATCIGGGFFTAAISESYRQGLYFMIPAMGEPLALIVLGYFLVPRMVEFSNNLTIAEAMGNLYGKSVQKVTAVFSILLCTGIVALQFKVSSNLMSVFFGVSSFNAVAASAIIVVIYSALGGIKAVTFTDIIQFFTFGTIIPVITFIVWGTLDDPYMAFSTIQSNELFNLSEVFDLTNPKFINSILLLLFFLIPDMQPVFFQRVVMAKSPYQAMRSFIVAGFTTLLILMTTMWVGIILLADNSNLNPDNLLSYLIEKYSYSGLKGLTAVGIMSIVMSTADSYINSASVIFSNDLIKKNNEGDSSLITSRLFAMLMGVGAFFLAFKASSVLNLLIIVLGFYMPIVTVPMLFGIFGFRSTSYPILIGMAAGFITVNLISYLNIGIDGVVPGMFANAVFLIISHYLLRQRGGWVGIKDDRFIQYLRSLRKKKIQKFILELKNFSFINFCLNNTPKSEATYFLFSTFSLISVFSTIYSLPYELSSKHPTTVSFIYDSVLIYSTLLLTYPIWPETLKNKRLIGILWTVGVPYILVCAHGLLVLISNLGQLQLMIFMINVIIIAILSRWYVALISMLFGIFLVIKFYIVYLGSYEEVMNFSIDLRFKIAYMLLLISSALIAFIRPKQEYEDYAELKISHLVNQIEHSENEAAKAMELKYEFLRNINHEVRTPITGMTSISSELLNNWDSLSQEKRKTYAKIVAESSDRLANLMLNILDFSKLSGNQYDLNREEVNIGNLIEDRLDAVKKTYINKGKISDFVLKLQSPNIILTCDKYYVTQLLDNIIINAINYGNNNLIEIDVNVLNPENCVRICIKDEGIGISAEELNSIFDPFVIGSRTRSSAGGRGIGLALCKRIAEIHGGDIIAESNGKRGSSFIITLPIKIV